MRRRPRRSGRHGHRIRRSEGAGHAEGVIHGGARERHRQVHRQGLQPEPAEGPERRRRRSWASARWRCSRTRPATTPRTSTQAIRKGAKLVVAAGFLLAPTEATYAKKFPNVNFAITDYTVHTAPFADKKGNVLPAYKNVEGLTYNANESGCLVGVLAAKMAQKNGGNAVGAVGGIKIPPVDIWIAGYKYCVHKVAPEHEGARAVLERLRRDGQVPDGRPERDRAGRQGALPGRRRLRSRHAQGGRRREASGASASTSTSTTTRSGC